MVPEFILHRISMNSKQRFVGPYVYKDGDTPILTYDRSQSSYDYVSRDFYKIVSNGETESKFTKAYHDEVLDCDMVNCSAPMYSADGTYMGCVTVVLRWMRFRIWSARCQ